MTKQLYRQQKREVSQQFCNPYMYKYNSILYRRNMNWMCLVLWNTSEDLITYRDVIWLNSWIWLCSTSPYIWRFRAFKFLMSVASVPRHNLRTYFPITPIIMPLTFISGRLCPWGSIPSCIFFHTSLTHLSFCVNSFLIGRFVTKQDLLHGPEWNGIALKLE